MTRGAQAVFALLVVATFGAFLVTQRLERTPPDVQRVMATPFFSPNSDGRFDAARFAFRLKREDEVTVRVQDESGTPVRTLASERPLRAYTQLTLRWDGRTATGARAADGRYRVRINLRDQGRSILLPRSVRLDTTPPRPVVLSIGPTRSSVPRPEILPLPRGGPAEIRFRTPSTRRPTEALVYRTSPSPGFVTRLAVADGESTTTWDGTKGGRRVRPGTYVVAVRTRDQAGNIGSAPPTLPPRPAFGATLPGRGGVTVRYLGAQSDLLPTVADTPVTFGVDARRRAYAWSLRRIGAPRPRKRGRGTRPLLRIRAPGGVSGLYLLTVRTREHATRVPFAVQSQRRRRVLVVLPAILWQGRNPVDDDGDGRPDVLADGLAVRRERILAGELPDDLVRRVAPLLAFLDRSRLRYDLTTDLALAAGAGPPLRGHTGVILAGDERWLPRRELTALRSFVRGGGRLATFGIDALRRQVRVTPRRLLDPTEPARADAFGAVVTQVRARRPQTVTNLVDRIGLFSGDVVGGTGEFRGYRRFEQTVRWPGTREVASAVTPDGRKVIAAARLGRGLVLRFGLPELPGRLGEPGNETELVRRTWTLLSR